MAEELQVVLFGGLRVERGGTSVAGFRSRKVQALLCYLAVSGRPQSREALAGLLWGDMPEEYARASLRQALANLNKLVGDYLRLDRTTAGMAPEGGWWLDVAAFEAGLRPPPRGDGQDDIDRLRAALALYEGDFLADVVVPDAPAFDEWAAGQRERLRQQALTALAALAEAAAARGLTADAVAALQRLLTLDPWREEALRRLITLLAADGQRGAALARYEQSRALLAAELGIEPAAETTVLAERIRAGELGPPPPVAPPTGRPTDNLPAPLTSFVGRATELAEIVALLTSTAGPRLLTLTGSGGVGKTRLALAATRAALPAYRDGVWLIELAALTDGALLPATVARVLGVVDRPDRPPLATLTGWLAGRQLLLVLDNCEHLVGACAALAAAVLSACPETRILATSRRRLGVAGEAAWRVPSLALPDANDTPSVATLDRVDAIRLFVDRARLVRPDFRLTPENAPAVAEICRRLDGLPLALELAAARLDVLTPARVAARLDDRFRLLTGGSRTALPRQQTLRAAIDWSHDLLDAAEQTLLRRLAVFADGWTLEAAERVGSGQWAVGSVGAAEPAGPDSVPDPPSSVLDLLARLVDQSLVWVDWDDPDGPRYHLLETVREYAAEKLAASGEATTTRDHHLAWCLALAETAAPALLGDEQLVWLRRLEAEQANARAALGWALERPDGPSARRLAGALGHFWQIRGYRAEGLGWLVAALAAEPAGPPATRALALWAAGLLAEPGSHQQASRWLEESLALSHALGDRRGAARALRQLGVVALDRGEHGQGLAHLEEALAVARAADDRPGVAWALELLGFAAADHGDYATGLPRLEAGLARLRALGDTIGVATALRHLAMARMEQGDAAGARAPLEEGLALLRALGNAPGVGWALHDLGRLALERSEPDPAATLLEESLGWFRAAGDTTGAAWALHNLGRALLNGGQRRRAVAAFTEGLGHFRELGHARGVGWALYNLAWVTLEDGEAARARAMAREGLTCFRAVDHPQGVAACLLVVARLATAAGQPARAAYWLGAITALHRAVGAPPATTDQARADAVARAARESLDAGTFAAAWEAGATASPTRLEADLADLLARPESTTVGEALVGGNHGG